MTSASGPGLRLTDMLRRLRARPVSSWAVGEREPAARAVLQRLADLAADLHGRTSGEEPIYRAVPDVGVAAIADQLEVLVRDARDAGAADDVLAAELAELARALSVR